MFNSALVVEILLLVTGCIMGWDQRQLPLAFRSTMCSTQRQDAATTQNKRRLFLSLLRTGTPLLKCESILKIRANSIWDAGGFSFVFYDEYGLIVTCDSQGNVASVSERKASASSIEK